MTYSNSWYKKEYLLGLTGMGGGAAGILVGGGPIATSDDDAYQIAKSLRFNQSDTTYLTSSPPAGGNRKKWTWAGWVKRSNVLGGVIDVFWEARTSGSSLAMFQFNTDDKLEVYNYPGSYTTQKVTTAKYYDPGAWYHICINCDTNNVESRSNAQNLVRIYVNGEEVTDFQTDNEPSTGEDWEFNTTGAHQLGRRADGTTPHFNGYLADVYWIDGLQLSPAAFGKFDSTGSFVPKAFARPAPNDGRTWSSDAANLTTPTAVFDGKVGVSGGTKSTSGSSQVSITFDPPLTDVVEFEALYHNSGLHQIAFNGNQLTEDGGRTVVGSGGGYWRRPPTGMKIPSTINSFQVRYGLSSPNDSIEIGGIRVNGVVLEDGKTDITTLNNPNYRWEWSASASGDNNATYPPSQGFNGNLSDSWTSSLWLVGDTSQTGNWNQTVTFPRSINVEKYIVFYYLNDSNTAGSYWELNDGTQVLESSLQDSSSEVNRYRLEGARTFTSIKQHRVATSGSNNGHGILGIEVDGHLLIDNTIDNSFNFKFSDATGVRNLGYSQVLNSSAGAHPAVGPGADDDNKSNLVFAAPGYDLADHHHTIKGSGSEKALTVSGDAAVSTTRSRFYGSSLIFDGTGDYIQTSSSSSDFTMGTGDFTIECWVTKSAQTHKGIWQISATSGGFQTSNYGTTLAVGYQSGVWQVYGAGTDHETSAYSITANKWYHLAYVRSSGTSKLYVNGESVISFSDTSDYDGTYLVFGGYYNTSYLHNGHIQDLKVYKGVAKYTADFALPSRNDFAVNNLTVTDGSTPENIDSLTDTPTNSGTDTGVGGELTGNFCTWNSLIRGDTTTHVFYQGNLEWYNNGSDKWCGGTLGVKYGSSTTNKWYWEVTIKHGNGGYGITTFDNKNYDYSDWGGGTTNSRIYLSSNGKLANPAGGSDLTYGSNTISAVLDVIGVALDLSPGGSNGTITFYKNGSSLGQAHSDIDTSKYWTPLICDYGGDPKGGVLNTGQRPFKYTAPTDHKCLCTQNILDTFGDNSDTNNPSKYFDVRIYTGIGANLPIDGMNFQPDLLWLKNRTDDSTSSCWQDVIGGSAVGYHPDTNAGEQSGWDGVITTAWTSDGFSASSHSYSGADGKEYVAWLWDAGTAASGANTNGSINISSGNQWVNDTAGFSITKFTSTGNSGATVGHGLSAAPEFMIIKSAGTGDWGVYHEGIGLPASTDGGLVLSTDAATNTASDWWASTNPTSTVFSLGNKDTVNPAGSVNMTAYCWRSIPGYSAFGQYTGNGTNYGPFVYTGFSPKYVMLKRTDGGGGWVVMDRERDKANPVNLAHYVNEDTNENTNWNFIDILSNGFIQRNTGSYHNANGATHVWAAFAEHPFKTTRAR